MKLAIFVKQFPVLSQTFVLNQVIGLIDLGIDVTVISLEPVNYPLLDFSDHQNDQLQRHTLYLQAKTKNLFTKIIARIGSVILGLLKTSSRNRTCKSLNHRYGTHARSLLLPAIAAKQRLLEFDIVLCHFGDAGVLAAKLRDIGVIKAKLVTIFHGFEISSTAILKKNERDYQGLFRDAELMLPVSHLWQKKLESLGCPAEKIIVHRMGVDLKLFQYCKPEQADSRLTGESLEQQSKPLKLFTIARFSEKKGIEYTLRALSTLDESVEYHYKLAGFGELEGKLRSLVIELKLEGKVSFVGALNPLQVKQHMIEADVFLQPSVTALNGDMEGVPVAIMEAMAIGTVVISTYHSGIPEIITHMQHGLLSNERDIIGLAANIKLLYNNLALRQLLIGNARKQVEKMANVEKLNSQLIAILRKLQGTESIRLKSNQ